MFNYSIALLLDFKVGGKRIVVEKLNGLSSNVLGVSQVIATCFDKHLFA